MATRARESRHGPEAAEPDAAAEKAPDAAADRTPDAAADRTPDAAADRTPDVAAGAAAPPPAAGADLAALARATRAGDQAAFRGLVDATYERLYRLAVSLLRDPDEADDVVQETYIRAWDRRAELRDPDRVVAYLGRITRNAAHDRLRWWTRWRGPGGPGRARPEPAVADSAAPADRRLVEAEVGADIARALAALGEKHRVVLLLREVEGMTYEEMAELLGVPVGTVESRLSRARAQLARRLRRLAPGMEDRS